MTVRGGRARFRPDVFDLSRRKAGSRGMAIYAIGDVHGCYDTLARLVDRIRFDANVDRLWFTGDLVNRGPKSLETLRFVAKLGDAATVVLGNHDLYILALAAGIPRRQPDDDLVDRILEAPDGARLLDWLRTRPLLHHDPELGYTLVHAGIPPCWGLEEAQAAARDVEATLSGPEAQDFLRTMPSDEPRRADRARTSHERQIFTINALTRMRYWHPTEGLDFKEKGPPGSQPPPLLPWYDVPERAGADLHILFGHWSTVGDLPKRNVYPLDTGCYWGRSLTALRLDGDAPKRISIPCRRQDRRSKTAGG
jgi:bis(5'-nucleosyl)-tetraphosphatase (symmetrical)